MLTKLTNRYLSAELKGRWHTGQSQITPKHWTGGTWLHNSSAEKRFSPQETAGGKNVSKLGKDLNCQAGIKRQKRSLQGPAEALLAAPQRDDPGPGRLSCRNPRAEAGPRGPRPAREADGRFSRQGGKAQPRGSRCAHTSPAELPLPSRCRPARAQPSPALARRLRTAARAGLAALPAPAVPGAVTHGALRPPAGSAGTSCPAPAGGSSRRSRPCCARRRGRPQPGTTPGTAPRGPRQPGVCSPSPVPGRREGCQPGEPNRSGERGGCFT